MTTQELQKRQQEFDAKQPEYVKALYATPRDEKLCHKLAVELLEIAKGTPLQGRQERVVARHEGKF